MAAHAIDNGENRLLILAVVALSSAYSPAVSRPLVTAHPVIIDAGKAASEAASIIPAILIFIVCPLFVNQWPTLRPGQPPR
jgi:hypothetical protein